MSASPARVELPELGSVHTSREELNALVKEAGKQRGYVLKQSITSKTKVNWYCSNKYGSPSIKCPAGFKAQLDLDQGIWTVTDMQEHNAACTQDRRKMLAKRNIDIIFEDSVSPPGSATFASSKAVKTTAASTAGGARGGYTRGRSGTMSSVSTTASSTGKLRSPPTSSSNGNSNSTGYGHGARARSYSSTSTSTAASTVAEAQTPAWTPVTIPSKVTILDAAYHFPGLDDMDVSASSDQLLLGKPMLGKRKRSASTASSKTILD